MSPLRWACKSTRQLARLLTAKGHPVSHMTVAQRLHGLRYSLQGNAKTKVQVSQIPRRIASGPAGEIPPGESIVKRC